MDKLIIIGTITKPQGIKGEVKIMPFTDDVMRFDQLKEVNIDNDIYLIEDVRISCQDLYLKFKGINDRNDAEKLRNKNIEIPKKLLKEPDVGRYYIIDLIGCNVIVDGVPIGKLDNVLQNGAADVYVVKNLSGNTIMFPALSDLILDINITEKTIKLDSKRFQEVVVYEN